MITTKELFDFNKIQLFNPYDGVEFTYSILQSIGYNNRNFKSEEGRKVGLGVIEKLLELDLIEVFHWGLKQRELGDKTLSMNEMMKYIQELWFIGADYADFHNMPMFKYKDCYIAKIEKLGMNHTTDWEWFVDNKIGNIEVWIENNRPG